MKKCIVCGKNAESDYCFHHKSRKPIKKKTVLNVGNANPMWDFFLVIWKKRKHVSEIGGEYLGREPLSIYFHHILEKADYPEYQYLEENIILVTLWEHTNLHSDIYRYPEVNKRRDLLKNKFNL